MFYIDLESSITSFNLFLQTLCLWDLPSELCFNTSKDHPGLFAQGPDENCGRNGLTNGLVILTS